MKSFSTIARAGNGALLAQGGSPSSDDTRGFHAVILCAEEEQRPSVGPRLGEARVVRVPLRDVSDPTPREIGSALRTAAHVARELKLGKKVLVTCHMGWNRSGLVSGFALMKLGMPAENVVALIKRKRGPNALSNSAFVKLLHLYGERKRKPRSLS